MEDVNNLNDVLLIHVNMARMAHWLLTDKREVRGNLLFLL